MESKANETIRRDRYEELRRILEDRRLEIMAKVQTAGGEAETSEAQIRDDIEFALLQMESETLSKIDEALARLDGGDFGYCYQCGDEIAEQRLRALPFAVRCKDCEYTREMVHQRERVLAGRRGSASLFADLTS